MPFFKPSLVDNMLDEIFRASDVELTGWPGADAMLKRTHEEILRDLNADDEAKQKRARPSPMKPATWEMMR